MRYSIRTVLVLILVVAAALCYYDWKRPRRIPIVAAMSDVYETELPELPELLLRYRDGKRIRETLRQAKLNNGLLEPPAVDTRFDSRYKKLKLDLKLFHQAWEVYETDDYVVRSHKEEFVPEALEWLDGSRPFGEIEAACNVLCAVGHANEAIDYLAGRFVKRIPQDPQSLLDWPFHKLQFTDDEAKLLVKHEEFFAEIVRQAESGELASCYDVLLARAGRPEIGMQRLLDWRERFEEPEPFYFAREIIDWATRYDCGLKNKNAISFVLRTVRSNKTAVEDRLSMAASLYDLIKESHPEEAESLKQLVKEISESLPTGSDSGLKALASIADTGDADFFRNIVADSETFTAREKYLAVSVLRRLGLGKEVEPAIIKLVESRELDLEFYPEYVKIRGKAAIPFLKTRIDELIYQVPLNFDLLTIDAAIAELAHLHLKTKDTATIEYFRKVFSQIHEAGGDQAYSRAMSVIYALEIVGDNKAQELWKQLPTPESEDSHMQLHWRLNPNLKPQDLVKFLNARFPVEPPIKQAELPEPGYWSVLDLLEKRDVAKFIDESDYTFDPGGGCTTGIAQMASDLWQLVEEESGFELRAAVQDQFETKLVVDKRLYTFQLTAQSNVWVNSAALVDILNAIVASHGATKRFFVFHSGDSDRMRYIVYIEPLAIKEMKEKFGIHVLQGCDYYLED